MIGKIAKFSSIVLLLVFVTGSLSVGVLGSLATGAGMDWYDGLVKPAGTPPNWLFGPVWSTLYLLIGVSGWLIARTKSQHKSRILLIFLTQLLLNLSWSFLFFGMNSTLAGLINILLLNLLVALYIFTSQKVVPLAGYLVIPYQLWILYAGYLNLALWYLN